LALNLLLLAGAIKISSAMSVLVCFLGIRADLPHTLRSTIICDDEEGAEECSVSPTNAHIGFPE
jgi:hypothetical protein